MHRSHGHCMTMGTASTMASDDRGARRRHAGQRGDSAVDARRYVLARMAGRRIVELVKQKIFRFQDPHPGSVRERDPRPGGDRRTTNAVIHLTAVARRIGVDLDLDDFDRLGRGVHTLVNLMPSGQY